MQTFLAFAGLSMCCTALLALVGDGAMRKTAALAMGLILAALWAGGIREAFSAFPGVNAPESVLEESGAPSVDERQAAENERVTAREERYGEAASLSAP